MVVKTANASVHDLVGDYLDAVKKGRATARKSQLGVIPHAATVNQYRIVLETVFLPWCDAERLTDPADVTEKALDRFLEHLQTQPGAKGRALSPTTIKTYGKVVNLMLAWANRRGDVPAVKMYTDEPPQAQFDLLTRSEIAALINKADNPRDRLIIRVLSDTGMRLGELLNLRLGDVKREDGHHFLRLRGKTGPRVAGIERDLYRDLMHYINGGRKGPDGDDAALFMSERSTDPTEKFPYTGYKPLTASGVQQMLKHLGEDAGLKKNIYPHLLRHGYATEALNNGMPETVLMRVLGHKSLDMISRVYVHMADQDVQRAMVQHLERVRES